MLVNGESVAQKDNSFNSYLVVPGSLQRSDRSVSGRITPSLDSNGSRRYLIQFNEFYFSHLSNTETLYQSKFSASEGYVLMQFCLNGDCLYSNSNYKEELLFSSLEHNILFIPANEEYLIFGKSKGLEIVNIYLDKNLLLKYIPSNHKLVYKIESGSWGSIIEKNMMIDPKMQHVLHDILNCEFTGHLKELYTRAKIIELLTLQLAQQEKED